MLILSTKFDGDDGGGGGDIRVTSRNSLAIFGEKNACVGDSEGTVLGDVSPEPQSHRLEVFRLGWGGEYQGPCKPSMLGAAAVVRDTLS